MQKKWEFETTLGVIRAKRVIELELEHSFDEDKLVLDGSNEDLFPLAKIWVNARDYKKWSDFLTEVRLLENANKLLEAAEEALEVMETARSIITGRELLACVHGKKTKEVCTKLRAAIAKVRGDGA